MKESLLFPFVSLVLPGGNYKAKKQTHHAVLATFCDNKHLGVFHCLLQEMAIEAARLTWMMRKYDVTLNWPIRKLV